MVARSERTPVQPPATHKWDQPSAPHRGGGSTHRSIDLRSALPHPKPTGRQNLVPAKETHNTRDPNS